MRISDWSSDVCSSDLLELDLAAEARAVQELLVLRPLDRRLHQAVEGLEGDARLLEAGQHGGHRAQRRERAAGQDGDRKEHTSELQSLMRISYAVFCLKKKNKNKKIEKYR